MQWTLERLVPEWDHHEVHHRWMPAPPERVWDAMWEIRVRDLTVATTLTRLRGGPRAWRRDPAEYADVPVMEAMAPRLLVAERPQELVLVDVARYAALHPVKHGRQQWEPQEFAGFAEPGWTKVGMNYRLQPRDGGTEVTTETRVVSTDPKTRRSFALYWTAVRVGSGMVRGDVLRAVAKAVA